jgi:hypothetical protein
MLQGDFERAHLVGQLDFLHHDEQRIAAVMVLFARVRGATADCDSVQEPAEQSPALEQSLALLRKPH